MKILLACTLLLCLAGCASEAASGAEAPPEPQRPAVIAGDPHDLVGAYEPALVTAVRAPEPAPASPPPAADQSRDEPSSGELQWEWMQSQEYWDSVEEEHGYDPDDGYWFEDSSDPTCEGAGIYGDYSPEGYADC
jgi:Spy/CpxP family protein refolding chaperone